MSNKIELEFIVDDKGSKVFEKAGARAENVFERLKKKTLSWKSALGLLAGATGLALVIKKVTELSAAQELAEKKLEQAMRSTMQYSSNLLESYKAYASSLQYVTGIGDETILGVMAMLQTFKLEEGTLRDATKATLDLAKATGQDLMSAAILVGKAAVGEVSTLKRYGIIVDEAAYKARGFRAVLDEINMEFGGQAAAQAQTYAGRIEKMKGYFGDLLEKFGDIITKSPIVLSLINMITENFIKWGETLEKNKPVVMAWIEERAKSIKDLVESLPEKFEQWMPKLEGILEVLNAMAKVASATASAFEFAGKAIGSAAGAVSIAVERGYYNGGPVGLYGSGSGGSQKTGGSAASAGLSTSGEPGLSTTNNQNTVNMYITQALNEHKVAQEVQEVLNRITYRSQ